MRKVIQIGLILFLTIFSYNMFAMSPATITSVQPTGGGATIAASCPGQTIRIVGGAFQSTGNTITINGGIIISTYIYISISAIEVVIPAATPVAGVGIIVTNGSGVASLPYLFIIGVDFVQPVASQTLCEGSSLTIAVTILSGGSLSYQWQKGGVNIGAPNLPVLTLANISPIGCRELYAWYY